MSFRQYELIVMKKITLIFCLFVSIGAFAQNKRYDSRYIHPNGKAIIVIFKTHFDIGDTHRVRDIVQYYRTEMIDKAPDLMDKTRGLPKEQQFSWTAPAWVMAKVLEDCPGQSIERRQRLEESFKSGRFVSHDLPFSVHSQILFPEDVARSFEASSFVTHKYGLLLARGARMTDVPSQVNIMATDLAQGGVKFMHIGGNWPNGVLEYPSLFWWQEPDGSHVLTHYS